jgi:hypothetical protein
MGAHAFHLEPPSIADLESCGWPALTCGDAFFTYSRMLMPFALSLEELSMSSPVAGHHCGALMLSSRS